MKRFALAALSLAALAACRSSGPTERYGFLTMLGRDTVAVESVARGARTVTIDATDRFPRVRRRHTEVALDDAGAIRRLTMDIHSPSEPPSGRERRVVAEVTADSVIVTKKDGTGTLRRAFATQGGVAMAHVPMMYSLYELYFDAAMRKKATTKTAGDTVQMRQFYIDREFDRFPLHHGLVRLDGRGRASISHDWLSGSGDATFDSAGRMLTYSGARSTYDVRVTRLTTPPDVALIAAGFEAVEARSGVRQLSVRDTARASIGAATIAVDYGRPLARGRTLLGGVIPYDRVWRTGANAATQLTTSGPISLGGLALAPGTYTLWTVPHADGRAELIVNRQHGQWGTEYDASQDLGRVPLVADTASSAVEEFTISIGARDARRWELSMAWGPFRWVAPISPSS